MFKRAYLEITNVCNRNCSFCIKTKRKAEFITPKRFAQAAEQIRPFTEYLYLHVMGEPLLHPELATLLSISSDLGFHVNLTTNGILLPEKKEILQACGALRKVSVSLHHFESNRDQSGMTSYLEGVWSYAETAREIVDLRLWNEGGNDTRNDEILRFLSQKLGFDPLSIPEKNRTRALRERLYLTTAEKFDWPSPEAPVQPVKTCYGMRTQFGVLCDGTVVPCCLDSEGTVALGNLFERPLEEILNSPRAKAVSAGFCQGKPSEELCRRCGFAARF